MHNYQTNQNSYNQNQQHQRSNSLEQHHPYPNYNQYPNTQQYNHNNPKLQNHTFPDQQHHQNNQYLNHSASFQQRPHEYPQSYQHQQSYPQNKNSLNQSAVQQNNYHNLQSSVVRQSQQPQQQPHLPHQQQPHQPHQQPHKQQPYPNFFNQPSQNQKNQQPPYPYNSSNPQHTQQPYPQQQAAPKQNQYPQQQYPQQYQGPILSNSVVNYQNYPSAHPSLQSPPKNIAPSQQMMPQQQLNSSKVQQLPPEFQNIPMAPPNYAASQTFQGPPPDPDKIILSEDIKKSKAPAGSVLAFAASTNPGLIRPYNEDRVSIVLNMTKPAQRQAENWPKCSFFGVFDGHGGEECADFLRDNLHHFIAKQPQFPSNPMDAIKIGFKEAEKSFLDYAVKVGGELEHDGSCAVVALIVEDVCYIANVGDSRAVLSENKGQKTVELTRDHKPTDESEKERIEKAGGKTLKLQVPIQDPQGNLIGMEGAGPMRVFPGSLSVSRTFGDAQAKLEHLGGNMNVVISDPEITVFKITQKHDFIMLASDGVYEFLNSKQAVEHMWKDIKSNKQLSNHDICGLAIESLLKFSIFTRTTDNITAVMVCFQQLQEEDHALIPINFAESKVREMNKSLVKANQTSSVVREVRQENINPFPQYVRQQEYRQYM